MIPELNRTYQGNSLDVLKTWPDAFVDCVVTSPPYWNLRDYGVKGQLGLEKTPEEFVAKMVEVFREVKRVLKPTGTLWLNIGDSYAGSGKANGQKPDAKNMGKKKAERNYDVSTSTPVPAGLKPKDLVGIPWMLAFALRADGWYLRSDIIWHKPNPMPESVTDRPTKAHEYIFLLTKQGNYFYDAESIKTSSLDPIDDRGNDENRKRFPTKEVNGIRGSGIYTLANKRTVWTVNPKPCAEAHFATFPEELIMDCIKAGASEHGCCAACGAPYYRILKKSGGSTGASWTSHENDLAIGMMAPNTTEAKQMMRDGTYKVETLGWEKKCKCDCTEIIPAVVLDPFNGSGTTGITARKLNRNRIGIELNPEYIKIEEKRTLKELGMFV